MAIIYKYPTTTPNGDELFLISDIDNRKATRNLSMGSLLHYIAITQDLSDFKLCGGDFVTNCPATADGQYIAFNSSTGDWEIRDIPVPTVPTEIIEVTAIYLLPPNAYVATSVPSITSYETAVIYKTTFDTSQNSSPTLNIASLGDVPLVTIDNQGASVPLPAGYIVPHQVYYLNYWNNEFQVSSVAPPPINNPTIFFNANGSTIAGNQNPVGGVSAGQDWSQPDPGNPGSYIGYTFQEAMQRIFYPYQTPDIAGFYMSTFGISQTMEVGETLAGGQRDFKIKFDSYFANVVPDSTLINDITNTGSNPLISGQITVPSSSYQVISVPNIGPDITYNIPASHSWQAEANDLGAFGTQGTIQSNPWTINWYYTWYYGFSSNTTSGSSYNELDTATIYADLTESNPIGSNNNISYSLSNPSASAYLWFVYPDAWSGSPVVINTTTTSPITLVASAPTGTTNWVDDGSGIFYYPVTLANAGVATASYRVYRSALPQSTVNGQFKITI